MLTNRTKLRGVFRSLISLAIIGCAIAGAVFAYRIFSVPEVTLSRVAEGPVVQAFYATGTLLPDREFPVCSNVEGTLVEVAVDKGDRVTKGQKLAVVEVTEFRLRLRQSQAELDLKRQMADPETSPMLLEYDAKINVWRKQYETARREFERLAQLRQSGGKTLTEYDRAEEQTATALEQIEALKAAKETKRLEFVRDLKVAQAALEIAEWNIDQQTIRSEIDGTVLDRPVPNGTRVRVNDRLLTTADVASDKLIMRVNVDEEDKTRVRLEQTVHLSLYSYPQRTFEGRVRRVYPKADPARRTFEVDVAVLAPDLGFSAGMTGELAFVVERKEKTLVVPSQAVQRGRLWTVRDHRLESLEVTLGLASIQRTEILAGVQLDDEVVVSPLGKLTPGTFVRTKSLDPSTAAGLNQEKKESATFQKF